MPSAIDHEFIQVLHRGLRRAASRRGSRKLGRDRRGKRADAKSAAMRPPRCMQPRKRRYAHGAWASHSSATASTTSSMIVNLLLVGGHMGRPGAGTVCVRGHSNVQGDRTMGVWERPPKPFLDALGKEFGFEPPRNGDTTRSKHCTRCSMETSRYFLRSAATSSRMCRTRCTARTPCNAANSRPTCRPS